MSNLPQDDSERTLTTIPQDDQERKDAPMARGLLFYFPWALFKVAAHSLRSDRKHNPGNVDGPHWAREKSADHPDCIVRHLSEAYGPPPETFEGTQEDWTEYHLTALAWRSLALLQEMGEARRGAAPGASCRFPAAKPAPEGGPDLYDWKTRQVVAHPAQKMAVAAFKAEENRQRALQEKIDKAGHETTTFPPDRFRALKPGRTYREGRS